MSGMNITAVSMFNSMERLTVISQNLANVNTVGYKRDIALNAPFEAQLSLNGITSVAQPNDRAATLTRRLDPTKGMLHFSGAPLDVAIEGAGYFEIRDGSGVFYSRDGSFQRDATGRLVNGRGMAVAGQSGEIRLNDAAAFIDEQGRVWQNEQVIDQLRIVAFDRPEQLEKRGAGLLAGGGATATEMATGTVKVRQGYVETSNVDTMQEMVDLMSTLRHFEMSQQVVKGYDEMVGNAIESLGKF